MLGDAPPSTSYAMFGVGERVGVIVGDVAGDTVGDFAGGNGEQGRARSFVNGTLEWERGKGDGFGDKDGDGDGDGDGGATSTAHRPNRDRTTPPSGMGTANEHLDAVEFVEMVDALLASAICGLVAFLDKDFTLGTRSPGGTGTLVVVVDMLPLPLPLHKEPLPLHKELNRGGMDICLI